MTKGRTLLLIATIGFSGNVFCMSAESAPAEKKQRAFGETRTTPTGQALTNAVAAAPTLYSLITTIMNATGASNNTLGNAALAISDVATLLAGVASVSASGSANVATVVTGSAGYVSLLNTIANGTGARSQVINDATFSNAALAAGSIANVLGTVAGRVDFASGSNIASTESSTASIVTMLNLIATRDTAITDATLNNLAIAVGNVGTAEATILSNCNGN